MGVAFLLPIPVLALAARQEVSFYVLFRVVFLLGEMLFLPCVLGVLSTMIFLPETDNDVLKNILTVPVSKTKIFISKCIVLMMLSIAYCLIELSASIVTSYFVGESLQGVTFVSFSVLCGIFMFATSLPVILFVISFGINYTISNIVSFMYAVVCFALPYLCLGPGGETLLETQIKLLPVVTVFRWYLGYFPVESRLQGYVPYAIPTTDAMIYMGIFSLIMILAGTIIYRRKEL